MYLFVKKNNYVFEFMQEDWVLCRVFYKSKTESNSTELSPQNVYDAEATAGGDIIPDAAQIILPGCNNNNYHHQIISSQSPAAPHHQNPNNLETFSQLNPTFLQLSHPFHTDHINELIMINSKFDEDHYGFLLDMDFEESNMGDGRASNTEDMKFEDEYNFFL